MATGDIFSSLTQLIGSDTVSKVASLTGLSADSSVILIAAALSVIFVWSLIWKGLALWKASKNNHKIWFVIILIFQTYGILEILYIYLLSKINWSKKQVKNTKSLKNPFNKNLRNNSNKKKKRR